MSDSVPGFNVDNWTLYSLRHTYATMEMLRGEGDTYTLSKQMGNPAAMIERHYRKLTATMASKPQKLNGHQAQFK